MRPETHQVVTGAVETNTKTAELKRNLSLVYEEGLFSNRLPKKQAKD